MAHGFLKAMDSSLEVFSAGTEPAARVNPHAVKVMNELGLDISAHMPHHVDEYLEKSWDYVITVCGGAKEVCPAFTGKVTQRLHIGFDDPADAMGTEEDVLPVYRRVRDEIREGFTDFYHNHIRQVR